MSIWFRLAIALASSALILSQSGCLSTSKFKSPQWLSFNRTEAATDASTLPDPSTLATPTTVTTEPEVSVPSDPPQVAANTGASTTTDPAVTHVTPGIYPSTNQPAPEAAPPDPTQVAEQPAGFLPRQTAGVTAPSNVQQGLYSQPPGNPAPMAPSSPGATAAVATAPVTPQPDGALTTWDQRASVPYPTPGAPATTSANPSSLYGASQSPPPGGPANTAAPATPIPSAPPTSPPSSPEPGLYGSTSAGAGVTQATYDQPAPPPAGGSHYEQISRADQLGSGWRPGSTTDFMAR